MVTIAKCSILIKFFLILALSEFVSSATEAEMVENWLKSANRFRSKDKLSKTEIVELYFVEKAGAQVLAQDLSKSKSPKSFEAFLKSNPHTNDEGEGLSHYIKSRTASEIQGSSILTYLNAHPNSFKYVGKEETGELIFEVHEMFESLKDIHESTARREVLARTLRDVSTLCTPNYSRTWQDWTKTECTELIINKSQILAKYSDPDFRSDVEREVNSIQSMIMQINAAKKFARAKGEILDLAKKKLPGARK